MRKVEFKKKHGDKEVIKGFFHSWGLECCEDGSYTVGIVEDYHGSVYCMFPKWIKFVEKETKKG
jgi:hypothetical protein